MRKLLTLVGCMIAAASLAHAQIPAGTQFAVSNLSPTNEILFLDNSGIIGSMTLPAGSGRSIEPSRDNRALVITDSNGVHVVDQGTAITTFIRFSRAISVSAGCHGEGDEFYSFRPGLVYRHDMNYANETVFTTLTPAYSINAGCWDGTTGGLVLGEFNSPQDLRFVDDAGMVTRSLKIPTGRISGLDWNPFDGSIIVSCSGTSTTPSLFRVDRSGTITTMAPANTPGLVSASSVEVRERGPEEYLITESGTPRHVVVMAKNGTITTITTSTANPRLNGPTDACYLESRPLWTQGRWVSGSTGRFYLNAPAQAGDFYQLAASFSHSPGIPVSTGTVHLAPDLLFSLSLTFPIFQNFAGVLDSTGTPNNAPTVIIPAGLSGLGLRVFFCGVTFNQTGITSVMNACGTIIR